MYYVEALIGAGTIDTMPVETYEAYRAHGHPAPRLEERVDAARAVLDELRRIGIDLDEVTQRLERDGVKKFADAYGRLLALIARRREAAIG